MNLSALHPELRRSFRFAPNPPVRSRLGRAIVRSLMSVFRPPRAPPGVRVERVELPGGLRVHVLTPEADGTGAALRYLHGGGMVIGTATQDYGLAFELARRLRVAVVLVDYRLAPENPFPMPLDDCARAWAWLVEHATARGLDVKRFAIGGQSAGGGLAAMLVQRLHDEGGVQPVAQWLFCRMLDDRTAADRSLDRLEHFLWNNQSNHAGWKAFLDAEPGGAVPPGAVPSRRADVSGLPPTWIGVGTVELFHAEDIAYASALRSAGVDVTVDEVPGAPHAFESIAGNSELAKEYLRRATQWLETHLRSSTNSLAQSEKSS